MPPFPLPFILSGVEKLKYPRLIYRWLVIPAMPHRQGLLFLLFLCRDSPYMLPSDKAILGLTSWGLVVVRIPVLVIELLNCALALSYNPHSEMSSRMGQKSPSKRGRHNNLL